jgi:hypothetical protein
MLGSQGPKGSPSAILCLGAQGCEPCLPCPAQIYQIQDESQVKSHMLSLRNNRGQTGSQGRLVMTYLERRWHRENNIRSPPLLCSEPSHYFHASFIQSFYWCILIVQRGFTAHLQHAYHVVCSNSPYLYYSFLTLLSFPLIPILTVHSGYYSVFIHI